MSACKMLKQVERKIWTTDVDVDVGRYADTFKNVGMTVYRCKTREIKHSVWHTSFYWADINCIFTRKTHLHFTGQE